MNTTTPRRLHQTCPTRRVTPKRHPRCRHGHKRLPRVLELPTRRQPESCPIGLWAYRRPRRHRPFAR